MNPADRVGAVRERIAAAAARCGRDPTEITLIAVSKTHSVDAVAAVAAQGVTDFGENRIQEAAEKVPVLEELNWHFIGHLQRNKARRAVELFGLIHSVDSLRLGRTLALLGDERGRPVGGLVEVNLGRESSKAGVSEEELPHLLDELDRLDGLHLKGLMTIPPWEEDPERVRSYFRRLARLRERCAADHPTLTELSMGMSGDFEVAIEEGATFVRVGTALFGPRRSR